MALEKYNLDANAMVGYDGNRLVPKSVWVSLLNCDTPTITNITYNP
jgi:hypothetical protein